MYVVQLHIDQPHAEEAAVKAEEDFFADCENNGQQDDNGFSLGSGALLSGDSDNSKTAATKVRKENTLLNIRKVQYVCYSSC